MLCPRCRSPFGDFATGEGITIDLCPTCRAVWFDAGELARHLGTAEDLPSLGDVQELVFETDLPCPRCGGARLAEIPYARGEKLTVATCASCQGTLGALTDLGPMRLLAARFPRTSRVLAKAEAPGGLARIAGRFDGLQRLSVKQRRRWLEMLTGFEQANEYNVIGNGMGSAFHVQEQSSGFGELLVRLLLGPLRPFEAHVVDLRRDTLAMRLVRPFRWFFAELEVRDADGATVATIVRRWTIVNTRYEVFDATGACIGEVRGRFFRPWTFDLFEGERPVGRVRKVWSGLVTEALSDADNFEVTFEPDAPARWKPLGLAAAVLLDVTHFERSNS